ncbi:uncharacterized protein RAG0_11884 [Rhynchosporium agropyri]|uniref:Uncharacterized protein n=3 Tax=Rhynchosporium TaxID=38037 RepID=A0A1E1MFB0_RHYSE|nr:uncharacterized protein RAG0_11884 [Rhynchosporium agropyri]CZT13842.1 uncharacterized protein RCO7_06467 [Rhynchosporium commune]CZT47793.1 uncharacterized protein RSE6_08398 [Rhynchosporium secalis]
MSQIPNYDSIPIILKAAISFPPVSLSSRALHWKTKYLIPDDDDVFRLVYTSVSSCDVSQ